MSGGVRFLSLVSTIAVLCAAPATANARAYSASDDRPKASQSLVQPVRASSFTLSAAAALGSRWGSVTSTFRTRQHNLLVGGAPNSFHLSGRAIDIARRPGVRHADIEASYRSAGFVLVESLDEGDHSHFAFGGVRFAAAANALRAGPRSLSRVSASGCAAANTSSARRRPDRNADCPDAEEPQEIQSLAPLVTAAIE